MTMWTKIWVGLGMFIWFIGFVNAGKTRKNMMPFERSFVRPPYLVYLLCGLPKAQNIPSGVMSVLSVIGQLNGLLWIIFGLVSPSLASLTPLTQGILLNIFMLLIVLYGWFLYRRSLYKVE